MILRCFCSARSISSSAWDDAVGEGLLDEDVLAVLEGLLGEGVVRVDRGDDRDGVDLRGGEDVVGIPGEIDAGETLAGAVEGSWIDVADRSDAAAIVGLEVSDYVGAPVAESDDADRNHGRVSEKLATEDTGIYQAPWPEITARGVLARIFTSSQRDWCWM